MSYRGVHAPISSRCDVLSGVVLCLQDGGHCLRFHGIVGECRSSLPRYLPLAPIGAGISRGGLHATMRDNLLSDMTGAMDAGGKEVVAVRANDAHHGHNRTASHSGTPM